MDWGVLIDLVIDWIPRIVMTASIITAMTPTPRDDLWLGRIYKGIEWLGLVVGKAKEQPLNSRWRSYDNA